VLVGDPCGNATTVTDYDGKSYTIEAFGSQCWMTQNLRTTHYSDGTSISAGSANNDSISSSTAYYYYPNGQSSYGTSTYGYLYNWKAVMRNSSSSTSNPSGVQGICPSGWHVPSQAEVEQFVNYIKSQNNYFCNSNSDYVAISIASASPSWSSTTSSNTCYIGASGSTGYNASGFNLPPAGYLYKTGEFRYIGSQAYMQTCTKYGGSDANYVLRIYTGSPTIDISGYLSYKRAGSVRCVKN